MEQIKLLGGEGTHVYIANVGTAYPVNPETIPTNSWKLLADDLVEPEGLSLSVDNETNTIRSNASPDPIAQLSVAKTATLTASVMDFSPEAVADYMGGTLVSGAYDSANVEDKKSLGERAVLLRGGIGLLESGVGNIDLLIPRASVMVTNWSDIVQGQARTVDLEFLVMKPSSGASMSWRANPLRISGVFNPAYPASGTVAEITTALGTTRTAAIAISGPSRTSEPVSVYYELREDADDSVVSVTSIHTVNQQIPSTLNFSITAKTISGLTAARYIALIVTIAGLPFEIARLNITS